MNGTAKTSFVLVACSVALVALAKPALAASRPEVVSAVSADRSRIRAHLERVERELRARDVSTLSLTSRAARARALDALHGYWQGGDFPKNTHHPGERVPYFIDDEGRPCAMAYLIQQSGAVELAKEVHARENNARVADMRTDLGPWLEANGLTAHEAARIQPAYCACGDVYNPVCASVLVDGGREERTFLNECVAKLCSGTTLVREGECTPGDDVDEQTVCAGGGVCSGADDEISACAFVPTSRRRSTWFFAAGALLSIFFLRKRRRAHR